MRTRFTLTVALFFGWLYTSLPSAYAQDPQRRTTQDRRIEQDRLLQDHLPQPVYLNDCVQYALQHQPIVRQSLIDQDIADRTVRSSLAAWYPQVNAGANVLHYLKQQVTLFPDPTTGESLPRVIGAKNTSTASFSVTQNIFSRDLLLANRTADTYRTQASQTTTSNKIDVVVNVSKAFYDVILTQRQVEILSEDITRLQRSLQDATNQYQGGIVDKTDPQRAQISLNNSRAQQKQYRDLVGAKYQTLKQLMGYPPNEQLSLTYDTLQLANEITLDTLAKVDPAPASNTSCCSRRASCWKPACSITGGPTCPPWRLLATTTFCIRTTPSGSYTTLISPTQRLA